MSINRHRNKNSLSRITPLALILLGICGLAFTFLINVPRTERTVTYFPVITPLPPTSTPVLPRSIDEVQAYCEKGECLPDCLNAVNILIQQKKFSLSSNYFLEDTQLVYYGIGSNDNLEKPRKFNVPPDLLIFQNDSDAHNFLWNYFKYLIRSQDRSNLVTFGVYVGSESNGMFDTTATENWIMEINMMVLSDADTLSRVLIHEYAHYLTLNTTQNDTSRHCKQEVLYSCQSKDSYLNIFFVNFWEDIYPELKKIKPNSRTYDEDILAFYKKHETRFIEEYSATSPIEDIAVSFESFILEPSPIGETVVDQKVQFFYKFPELVQLRKQIIKNICTFDMAQ